MAELADAHGSGTCGSNTLRVQVPFPAFFNALFYKRAFFFCLFEVNLVKMFLGGIEPSTES